jgi:hypothetical protein
MSWEPGVPRDPVTLETSKNYSSLRSSHCLPANPLLGGKDFFTAEAQRSLRSKILSSAFFAFSAVHAFGCSYAEVFVVQLFGSGCSVARSWVRS